MSTKDYELLAYAVKAVRLRAENCEMAPLTGDDVAVILSDFLESDNPRFSREKFLAATK